MEKLLLFGMKWLTGAMRRDERKKRIWIRIRRITRNKMCMSATMVINFYIYNIFTVALLGLWFFYDISYWNVTLWHFIKFYFIELNVVLSIYTLFTSLHFHQIISQVTDVNHYLMVGDGRYLLIGRIWWDYTFIGLCYCFDITFKEYHCYEG